MKHFVLILISLPLLFSCAEQGPAMYRGYYSFKTGGTIDIEGKVYQTGLDTTSIDTLVNVYTIGCVTIKDTSYNYNVRTDTLSVRDTSFLRHLVPESGQMHILSQSADRMILTMNVTGGDPVVFDASFDGENLLLSPTRRMVAIRLDNERIDDEPLTIDMSVGGIGKRYGNMVIFTMDYRGNYSFKKFDGSVSASRVDCIATENE